MPELIRKSNHYEYEGLRFNELRIRESGLRIYRHEVVGIQGARLLNDLELDSLLSQFSNLVKVS